MPDSKSRSHKIVVVVWDDEPETVNSLMTQLKEMENDKGDITPRYYQSAIRLIDDISGGLRPYIALIDLKSKGNEDVGNVDRAFVRASEKELDIKDHIDFDALGDYTNWLQRKYYGIGILALLRAVSTPVRFAYTAYRAEGDLIAILGARRHLANYGVLNKDQDTAFKAINDIITERRLVLAESRDTPDLYDVVVLEDDVRQGEAGLLSHLRVRITEKKTAATADLTLSGDSAVILKLLLETPGQAVPGRKITQRLNDISSGASEYVDYTEKDRVHVVQAMDQSLARHLMLNRSSRCRLDNDIMCKWQRTGQIPSQNYEGYSCLQTTGGFCPKLQRKRNPTGAIYQRFYPTSSEYRNLIRKLRNEHLAVIAAGFSSGFECTGKQGFLWTLGKRGYAVAASSA